MKISQPPPKGNPTQPQIITVAELRMRLLDELNKLDDNDQIMFGGGQLSLHRLKNRGPINGPQIFDIEFNEAFKVTAEP